MVMTRKKKARSREKSRGRTAARVGKERMTCLRTTSTLHGRCSTSRGPSTSARSKRRAWRTRATTG
jgi:hypothetical protein